MRAGKSSFDVGRRDVPPALIFNEFAASLGRWRAFVKRAGARHFDKITAGARAKVLSM